jgi:hypothetical protein
MFVKNATLNVPNCQIGKIISKQTNTCQIMKINISNALLVLTFVKQLHL